MVDLRCEISSATSTASTNTAIATTTVAAIADFATIIRSEGVDRR